MQKNRFAILMITLIMMSITLKALPPIDYVSITTEATDDCCIKIMATASLSLCHDVFAQMEVFDQAINAWAVVRLDSLGPQLYVEAIFCPDGGVTSVDWKVILTEGLFTREFTGTTDVGNCCYCPDEASDWLTLSLDSESPNCGPGQCEVTPVLNMPQFQADSCFFHYNCKTADTDFEQQNYSMNDPLPTYCISNGEKLHFEIVLMKYDTDDPDDPRFEHCILSDSVGPCEMNDGEPCYPDFYDVTFNKGEPFTFTMGANSPCPGCVIAVDYVWRTPEGIRQDLQITGIYFDENGPCAGCTIEDIYEQALPQAMLQCINYNQFEPSQYPEVNDQWRVSQAGCWGLVVVCEIDRIYGKWVPCGCDTCGCCLHRFEVAMIDDTPPTLDITPIGTPIVFDSQCDSILIEQQYDVWKPCQAACEWPGLVNGEYVKLNGSQTNGKIAYGDQPILHEVVSSYFNDELNVEINTVGAEKAIITFYDLNGNQVSDSEYSIHRGINNLLFNTSDMITGTYLFTVTIDGRTLPAEKLIIVR